MYSDVRQAFRTITSSKAFSTLVIGVLAVGIGANAAIFSIVNGVLLKPLPFADSAHLVAVMDVLRGEEQTDSAFPDFLDLRAQTKTLDGMAAYLGNGVTMTGQGNAASLSVANVTADLFPMLGVRPLVGRLLTSADDKKDAPAVALISESLWQHRFGRRPSIAGESIKFDGKPLTIVGVMPADFQFPFQAERVDAWLPVAALPLTAQWMEQRGAHFIHVLGHLRPGVSMQQANAELQTISANLATAYPKTNTNRVARAVALQDVIVREFRLGLVVLLAAVGALLLVACANVANLLLARGTARQREMAVRAAMGAPRGRLIRQLLIESLLLAVAGGALGALIASWAVPALVAASPVEIPRLRDVTIDRGVLAFTMLVSMATGVLFGLAPALLASRANAADTLRDAGRTSSGGRSTRTRQMLVVAELALSLVLLATAGLLMRSLVALQHVDPGFIVEHAVTADLSLPSTRYPDTAALLTFYHRLVDELKALPGASASAVSTSMPLSGSELGVGFTLEGRAQPPGSRTSATYFAVSPDYFGVMGIRIIKGRTFSERDDQQNLNVIVISEAFAHRFWPNDDPIGKRLTIGYNNTGPREIIGIVGDVKNGALGEMPHSEMYTPFAQTPWPFVAMVVRTPGDPAAVAGSLRAMLTRLDPEQASDKTKTMAEFVAGSVATPRFTALLTGTFAVISLLLAGFGLFSVMAYSVSLRRREIGIRMALGAQASDVQSMIVSQALRVGGIGLGVGLVGAFAVSRLLSSLLFGVSPNDPTTFAGVSATLTVVLVLAAYLPARRATRVDPTVALRTE